VETHHRLAEHGGFYRMLGEPVENRHAQRFLETALPGLNRIQQLAESADPPVARDRKYCRTSTAGCAGFERLAERSQAERARLNFSQNPEARERSQQTIEGRRVRAC